MLQVKNFKILALCALFLVALTSCKEDPFTKKGKTEDPHWAVTVENNMTTSMTAIVQVAFAQQSGTLAAFIGADCCGIAEYVEGLYFLYITPPSEEGGKVQLRFYDPALMRIFKAKETFTFVNDSHIGSVSEPFTTGWEVDK